MPLIFPPIQGPTDDNTLANLLGTLPPANVVSGGGPLGAISQAKPGASSAQPTVPSVDTSIQPQSNVAVPGVLGSVSAPSRSSLALNGADNDVQAAKDKLAADTPQKYDWHAHGVLGNIGHIAARFGNIAGDVLDPAATSLIPHSDLYNERKLAQDQEQVDKATGNQQAAQRESDTVDNENSKREADAPFRQSEIDKNNAATKHYADSTSEIAAKAGLKSQTNPDGSVSYVPDESSPVYREQQMKMGVQQANEEYTQAKTEVEHMQGDPNSPKNQAVRQRLALAAGNLQMRQQEYLMHAYGTDASGNALPGSLQDANGSSVGSVNAANVRPTATQRDAAGRAEIGDSLRTKLLGDLQRPEIRSQLGPLLGRAKTYEQFIGTLPPELAEFGQDLNSYAAFQAGMHPVRGIGALEYFDKQLGGLGQNPEQLEGKLKSGAGVSKSVQGVGTPKTSGGNAGQPGHTNAPSGAQGSFTVHAPDGSVHQFNSQAEVDAFNKLIKGQGK